jgi:hypothetical protein
LSHRVQEEEEELKAEDSPHSSFENNLGVIRLKKAFQQTSEFSDNTISSMNSSITVSPQRAKNVKTG